MALVEAGKALSAPGGSVPVASGRSDFSSVPLVLVVVALVVERTIPIDGLPLPTRTPESAQLAESIASHKQTQRHPQIHNNGIFKKIRLTAGDHKLFTLTR